MSVKLLQYVQQNEKKFLNFVNPQLRVPAVFELILIETHGANEFHLTRPIKL